MVQRAPLREGESWSACVQGLKGEETAEAKEFSGHWRSWRGRVKMAAAQVGMSSLLANMRMPPGVNPVRVK